MEAEAGQPSVESQGYQLCEVRECANFERCDSVGVERSIWKKCEAMLHALLTLLFPRNLNDVRPENTPDGRDVMTLEYMSLCLCECRTMCYGITGTSPWRDQRMRQDRSMQWSWNRDAQTLTESDALQNIMTISLFRIYQRCEVREHASWERCYGVKMNVF